MSLTLVHVTGTTALNGGTVTTSGAQNYDGSATLGADAALTASGVTFGNTVNGAHALTVRGNGTFSSAVGNSASLSSVHVTGTAALNGGTVTTTGAQAYDGATTLGVDTVLTGSGLAFGSTINGMHVLAINGNATFSGAVGNSASLSSVVVTGTAVLNGGTVTTSGGQTYNGAATLGTDTTLAGTTLGLAGVTGGGHNLTLNNIGTGTLNGAVSGVNALTAIGSGSLRVNSTIFAASVNDTEATTLNGGTVTTTAGQSYSGSTTLGADTTLTGTTLSLSGVTGGGHGLTLNNSAAGTLNGAVSGVNVLTAGGSGSLTVNSTISALSVNDSEVTTFNGGTVTTSGPQTYAGPATLGADTVLTASGLTLGSTVNGAHVLTVNVSGVTGFGGPVGNVTALSSLTVGTGQIVFNGGTVTTSGAQTYSGPVTLGGDATLTASTVTFASTVDGAHALTVNASGATTFGGSVGNGTALSRLTVGIGQILLNGSAIMTSGTQTYNGAVSLGSNARLTAGQINLSANAVMTGSGTITGPLNNAGTIMTSGGTLTFTGIVTNNGTMRAPSGTALVFFGPMVNNGVIEALDGTVSFDSTFINNGVLITSNSIPQIVSIDRVGSDIRISFTTASSPEYVVEYTDDLLGNSWTKLAEITDAGGLVTVTDPGAAALPKRFYRVGLVVP